MAHTVSRIRGRRGAGVRVARAWALGLALATLAACAVPPSAVAPPPAALDLIVRGGSVLDGTGKPAYPADVGVAAGRITRIGDLSRDTAITVIDASGLVVTPGFININLVIEYRDAEGKPERLATSAAELVALNVDSSSRST